MNSSAVLSTVPALGVSLWLLSSCTALPEWNDSRIDGPRVIAVIAEPPEARPGQDVAYSVLAVDTEVELRSPTISAVYCTSPQPLTENGSVSTSCSTEEGLPLTWDGERFAGTLPREACSWFGPDPPPGDFRPRDADATGGYFVPVRFRAFGATTLFLQRVRCNAAQVDADVAREFAARYVPNRNPASPTLTLTETARGFEVYVGVPRESAEAYVRVETRTRQLVSDREELHATCFTTRGVCREAAVRLEASGELLVGSLSWRLPPHDHADARLWVVVRDSRGGSSYAAL